MQIFNSIKYYLVASLSGMTRNKLMAFISVTTVALCLFLLGFSIITGRNLEHIAKQMQAKYEIQAFIDEGFNIAGKDDLEAKIKGISGIGSVEFESKEQALVNLKALAKNDETELSAFEGLDSDNPFRNSFKISLINLENTDFVVGQLRGIADIAKVKSNKEIKDKLMSFNKLVGSISFGGIIIFALIAIFIISNTIKLAVMSRRREIGIMKLVGATDWFIRWPFIIEGIIVGIIGAVAAYIPIFFGYNAITHWWTGFLGIIKLIPPSDIFILLLYLFIAGGAFIGSIGSLLSVRRHLHI